MAKKLEKKLVHFFSIVAGSTLETLTLTLNSFVGIFSKVFKQKCRTAILQISFMERMYFEIYTEIAKFFEKLRYRSTRAKWEQNIFCKKYSIFILFDFREHQKCVSQASS